MNLGKNFKRYRNIAGLTQREAAEIIGINSYQLGNYETDRSEPSIRILIGMSKAYGVSIDELVGNTPLKTKENDYSEENNKLEQMIKEFVDQYLEEHKEK